MKNQKLAKILSLIVALVALVTCIVVMNVSAETTTPEITSTNLVYGDQIQIMFATNVPTTEALGDLKVAYYKKNPATNPDAEVFYATALPADSKYNYEVDDVTYWTFVTDGIPASAVSAERFATAFYGDAIPQDATYKTYSVMEYLFTRLYKQDFISKEDGTEDGDRKQLYLNMIDYTAFAQKVLVNNNDEIAEDIRLITEYNYVYAKGCKINGGSSSLILPGNGEVTITLNDGTDSTDLTGWIIYTYDVDGNLIKSEPAEANTISVTSHTVIAPPAVDEDPTYIEFDDWAAGLVGAHSSNRITSFTDGTNNNFTVINDNGNTKLQYNSLTTGTNDRFHISAHNSSENANVTVFEADIEWLDLVTIKGGLFYIDLYAGSDRVYRINISQADSGIRLRLYGIHADGSTAIGDGSSVYANAVGAKYSSVYLAPKAVAEKSNTLEYQFKLKVEYYHSVDNGDGTTTGKVKWYLDGANWGDHDAPVLENGVSSIDMFCSEESRELTYTFDNLRIENTEKVYVPYAPKQ